MQTRGKSRAPMPNANEFSAYHGSVSPPATTVPSAERSSASETPSTQPTERPAQPGVSSFDSLFQEFAQHTCEFGGEKLRVFAEELWDVFTRWIIAQNEINAPGVALCLYEGSAVISNPDVSNNVLSSNVLSNATPTVMAHLAPSKSAVFLYTADRARYRIARGEFNDFFNMRFGCKEAKVTINKVRKRGWKGIALISEKVEEIRARVAHIIDPTRSAAHRRPLRLFPVPSNNDVAASESESPSAAALHSSSHVSVAVQTLPDGVDPAFDEETTVFEQATGWPAPDDALLYALVHAIPRIRRGSRRPEPINTDEELFVPWSHVADFLPGNRNPRQVKQHYIRRFRVDRLYKRSWTAHEQDLLIRAVTTVVEKRMSKDEEEIEQEQQQKVFVQQLESTDFQQLPLPVKIPAHRLAPLDVNDAEDPEPRQDDNEMKQALSDTSVDTEAADHPNTEPVSVWERDTVVDIHRLMAVIDSWPWSVIAARVPNRSEEQCHAEYRRLTTKAWQEGARQRRLITHLQSIMGDHFIPEEDDQDDDESPHNEDIMLEVDDGSESFDDRFTSVLPPQSDDQHLDDSAKASFSRRLGLSTSLHNQRFVRPRLEGPGGLPPPPPPTNLNGPSRAMLTRNPISSAWPSSATSGHDFARLIMDTQQDGRS